jgi:hypothetical protein
VISRIPSIQLDNLAWLGPAACNLDVQLCRHGPVTVLIAFLNINRLCHMAYLVEFHVITKILLTLTLSQQGPINVERARSMARSMTSPIHIFGLVHAM